jgi:UDP-N-acetylmuramate-alanine ligase
MVVVNGDDPNAVEVAKDCLAQMVEVGFSKNCANEFETFLIRRCLSIQTGDDVFEIPLVGEFNVHNAAMAATAARFYDVPTAKIASAFTVSWALRAGRSFAAKLAALK